jgi:hypothetical protein
VVFFFLIIHEIKVVMTSDVHLAAEKNIAGEVHQNEVLNTIKPKKGRLKGRN